MLLAEAVVIEASCQRAVSVHCSSMLCWSLGRPYILSSTSQVRLSAIVAFCSLATLTRSQSSVPEDVVWGDLEE